jgi:hypothetical protein
MIVQLAEISQPSGVHVGPSIEEPDLGAIPSLVAVVADMTWLVHILKAMDEEPQGEPAVLD